MATQAKESAPQRIPGGWALGYVTEVRTEMRKVSWPPRNELINNTALTLAVSLAIALLIFFSDQMISKALAFVYS
ncbi:MAG: preprotein translocase subunit SecE [Bacteroidetes bacterium]|nr:preprotein translocase subunit SecE [Bacteroidota bacterium]